MEATIARLVQESTKLLDMDQEECEEMNSALASASELELVRIGYALVGLKVVSTEPFVPGVVIVTMKAPNARVDLTQSIIAAGDMVAITSNANWRPMDGRVSMGGLRPATGVVRRITSAEVAVVVGSPAHAPQPPSICTVQITAGTAMRKRVRQELASLASCAHRPRLQGVLFGELEPAFAPSTGLDDLRVFNEDLDDSQRAAVAFALSAVDVALVHGPPGTGKTQTLAEIIRQLVAANKRVLACGPSNVSVDCIAERLIAAGIGIVRLGNPARIKDAVMEHSLVKQMTYFGDLHRQLKRCEHKLRRCQNHDSRLKLRKRVDELRNTLHALVDAERHRVIAAAEVVLATLDGAGSRDLDSVSFDVAIIDESTQSMEAECWVAANRVQKIILAGDPHQLPLVVSGVAEDQLPANPADAVSDIQPGVSTMFDRVKSLYGDRICVMLQKQYRMHNAIMAHSSANLYDGQLQADDSVAYHVLCDLRGVRQTPDTTQPLVLVDTSGAGMDEARAILDLGTLANCRRIAEAAGSLLNEGEATAVVAHIERLIAAGVKGKDIGVIAPYRAQVRHLRQACKGYPAVEVHTVDSFQGREKEAIILTMVRSNPDNEIGYLHEYRRMNVAITRARRHLCVIGDCSTICGTDSFVGAFMAHMKDSAAGRPA